MRSGGSRCWLLRCWLTGRNRRRRASKEISHTEDVSAKSRGAARSCTSLVEGCRVRKIQRGRGQRGSRARLWLSSSAGRQLTTCHSVESVSVRRLVAPQKESDVKGKCQLLTVIGTFFTAAVPSYDQRPTNNRTRARRGCSCALLLGKTSGERQGAGALVHTALLGEAIQSVPHTKPTKPSSRSCHR